MPCAQKLLNLDGSCYLWTLYSDHGPVPCSEKVDVCRKCVPASKIKLVTPGILFHLSNMVWWAENGGNK